MKNQHNVGQIPAGDPKSFRLQAMKKFAAQRDMKPTDGTELTTNMLAENLAPFSLEIYEKELAIKCQQKKGELEKMGFNFGDAEEVVKQPEQKQKPQEDSKVPELVPQSAAETASTS